MRGIRGGTSDVDKVVGYLEMMNAEIDRCTGVTRRLLLLSRPPQAQPQVIRLHQVVADTVGLLDYDARSRGIAQSLVAVPDDLCVLADDSDLRMVILNLVQNAHHAMPKGGEMTVASGSDEASAWVEIRDTGCGIATADLPHIFDPFFSRRADGEAGTGLGLTICRTIVERYQGRIDVASEVGAGTVFRVTLPRVLRDD